MTGGDEMRSDKGIEDSGGVGRTRGASVILSNRERPPLRTDVVGEAGRGCGGWRGVDFAESVNVESRFEAASSSLLISPSSRMATSRIIGGAES